MKLSCQDVKGDMNIVMPACLHQPATSQQFVL